MAWRLVNVAGRVGKLDAQLAAVIDAGPDLVALQEVTTTTAELWRAGLSDYGLINEVFSFDLPESTDETKDPRRLGLLIASRWPLQALSPSRFGVPWPERVSSARIGCPAGPIEVISTHVPPGVSNGLDQGRASRGPLRRAGCAPA
jgi:endonuclease/exonuclease/phosphatase family metal-dependent hydrolase